MAVSAEYSLQLTVQESVALSIDTVTDPTLTKLITGTSGTLDSTTSAPVTKSWIDTRQLTAGTDAIDLTALGNGALANITFSGLKVQLVKISCASANTSPVIFAPGASNGYSLFGDADGQVALAGGAVALFFFNEKLGDVGSGAKAIDITSSDTDAIYTIQLVAG